MIHSRAAAVKGKIDTLLLDELKLFFSRFCVHDITLCLFVFFIVSLPLSLSLQIKKLNCIFKNRVRSVLHRYVLRIAILDPVCAATDLFLLLFVAECNTPEDATDMRKWRALEAVECTEVAPPSYFIGRPITEAIQHKIKVVLLRRDAGIATPFFQPCWSVSGNSCRKKSMDAASTKYALGNTANGRPCMQGDYCDRK